MKGSNIRLLLVVLGIGLVIGSGCSRKVGCMQKDDNGVPILKTKKHKNDGLVSKKGRR